MTIKCTTITKSDQELQIVYGEVYAPNVPDSDGDFMDIETIRKAAHKFIQNNNTHNIDKQHENELTGSYVVESFIARKGDPDFIEDAWVVGVHIPDPTLWDEIKKGEINGFSMEASVRGTATTLELEIPDVITGGTTETNEHTHKFFVKFAEDGTFLGGYTDDHQGHTHTITYGTETGESEGHKHLFSFVEAM